MTKGKINAGLGLALNSPYQSQTATIRSIIRACARCGLVQGDRTHRCEGRPSGGAPHEHRLLRAPAVIGFEADGQRRIRAAGVVPVRPGRGEAQRYAAGRYGFAGRRGLDSGRRGLGAGDAARRSGRGGGRRGPRSAGRSPPGRREQQSAAACPCGGPACTAELFPTATASLKKAAPALPANADWSEVGVDDPRIIWKSDIHLVHGALPPLVDPDTGIVFTGDISETTARAEINTIAATDPRVRFMVNTGEAGGYRETGGIVPLGIAPPSTVNLVSPNGSLAAFRVEMWLPGAITESLTQSNKELRMAIESERTSGIAAEQTIAPLPPSHLRRATAGNTADSRTANDTTLSKFKLERLVPYDENDADMKSVRYQEGYNHFVSPWIVAIADPRASIDYKGDWANLTVAQKAKLGCDSCNRPDFLDPAKNPGLTNVYELLTTGRFLSARPEMSLFPANSPYAYLAAPTRLRGRVSTVMADTVRPNTVLTAADAPPVAGGALQETVYAPQRRGVDRRRRSRCRRPRRLERRLRPHLPFADDALHARSATAGIRRCSSASASSRTATWSTATAAARCGAS